jgi:alkylhydroperoxidase family enzyme
MSRLPLLPVEDMPDKTRDMVTGGKSEMSALNINKMMAHAENSARHFMRLGNSLLTQAKLDARLRELAILRIAILCKSQYEWYQHELLAKQVGVSEKQIAELQVRTDSAVFNEQEQAVLRYTEEVTLQIKSSDQAFAALAGFLSHRELVELTLTIGFYNLVARFLENTEVEVETYVD